MAFFAWKPVFPSNRTQIFIPANEIPFTLGLAQNKIWCLIEWLFVFVYLLYIRVAMSNLGSHPIAKYIDLYQIRSVIKNLLSCEIKSEFWILILNSLHQKSSILHFTICALLEKCFESLDSCNVRLLLERRRILIRFNSELNFRLKLMFWKLQTDKKAKLVCSQLLSHSPSHALLSLLEDKTLLFFGTTLHYEHYRKTSESVCKIFA